MNGKLEAKFVSLIEENQRIIHKICKIYANNVEEHQDLFQEIAIQLWKAYPNYRGNAKFSTWMYSVSEALIAIKSEIQEVIDGKADAKNNVLKNAPHTEQVVISDAWDKPYSREKAAYPLDWVRIHKFFATVSRVDEAFGDRNLVCTCEPIESYM